MVEFGRLLESRAADDSSVISVFVMGSLFHSYYAEDIDKHMESKQRSCLDTYRLEGTVYFAGSGRPGLTADGNFVGTFKRTDSLEDKVFGLDFLTHERLFNEYDVRKPPYAENTWGSKDSMDVPPAVHPTRGDIYRQHRLDNFWSEIPCKDSYHQALLQREDRRLCIEQWRAFSKAIQDRDLSAMTKYVGYGTARYILRWLTEVGKEDMRSVSVSPRHGRLILETWEIDAAGYLAPRTCSLRLGPVLRRDIQGGQISLSPTLSLAEQVHVTKVLEHFAKNNAPVELDPDLDRIERWSSKYIYIERYEWEPTIGKDMDPAHRNYYPSGSWPYIQQEAIDLWKESEFYEMDSLPWNWDKSVEHWLVSTMCVETRWY